MKTPMNRRHLLLSLLASATPALAWATAPKPAQRPSLKVWKDPNCGCCKDWIAHLAQHGLHSQVIDEGNTEARQRLGMPARYGSCHTALVQGYVIEGHVPAADVLRLLRERPKAVGLAVPGMPIGSPGMDGPAYGGRRQPYQVLLILQDGGARVYSTHA